jgi:hypothetical protein
MKHYLSPTNQIFAYELDGSQDHLIPENFTEITDSQANDIREQINQTFLNSLTYIEKRLIEYPTFGEQFDKLYHEGYDAWKESIKTIKDKYPKS